MTDFRTIMIAILITGLFVTASAGYVINMSIDNNLNNTVVEDPDISASFSSLNKTLLSDRETIDTQIKAVEQSPVSEGAENLIIPGTWNALKVFGGLLTGMGNLILGIPRAIGIPNVVLVTIMSILGLIIALGWWSIIRSGRA